MLRIFKYHRKLCKIHVTIHALWPDQFCKCGFCSQFVYSFKNRGLAAKPWAGPKFRLRNQNFRGIIVITPQTCIFAHGDVSKWSQRAWLEIKLSARARGFESHRLRHKPGKTSCFAGFILTFGRYTQSAPATNIDMALPYTKYKKWILWCQNGAGRLKWSNTIKHNAKKARASKAPRFLGFIAYSPNTALW